MAAQALLAQNAGDDQKLLSQIKAFLARRLSRSAEIWYTNYLDDFFESKLAKSLSFAPQARPRDYPSLSLLNPRHLLHRIELLSSFFCGNVYLLPISIDFREVGPRPPVQ